MKYLYREHIRNFMEGRMPQLDYNERIVSNSIIGSIMIYIIEKSIPFHSRIRK